MSEKWRLLFSAGLGGFVAVLYDLVKNDHNNVGSMAQAIRAVNIPCPDYIPIILVIAIAIALCWIFDEKTKVKSFYLGLSVFGTLGFLTAGKAVRGVDPSQRGPAREDTRNHIPDRGPLTVVHAANPAAGDATGDVWVHLNSHDSQSVTLEIAGKTNGYFARSSFDSDDIVVSLAADESYTLTASATGYKVVRFDVLVKPGDYRRFDADLQPTPIPVGVQKLLGTVANARAYDGFGQNCALPYAPIAVRRSIDAVCGISGLTEQPAQRLQDTQKNNLCAQGPPITITLEDFRHLQRLVVEREIPFGRLLPEDRAPLRDIWKKKEEAIGEGRVARYVGYVARARVQNGESVNCRLRGPENNDIHVVVVHSPDDDECESITAEVIPHYRPTAWDANTIMSVRDHPVRITGQLFFDASHRACEGSRRSAADPARASTWEIHPAYAIDVCKDTQLGACRAEEESRWVPLHTWANR